jgi:phosphoribosylaminoimidazole carboxylase (NCAIR synthetase)
LAEATDYFEEKNYDEAEAAESKQLSHMYEVGYDGDGNAVANQKEVVDKHLSNLHEADKIWSGEKAMVQLDSQISTLKKHKKHTAKSLHKKRHHHQE